MQNATSNYTPPALMSVSAPIIHIADDQKFIDAAFDTYEAAFPAQNLFIIILKDTDHKVRHLSPDKPYVFVYADDNCVQKVQTHIRSAKILVIHGMYGFNAAVLCKLRTGGTVVVGNIFSAEVYLNPCLLKKHASLMELVNNYDSSNLSQIIRGQRFLKKLFATGYYKTVIKSFVTRNAHKRIGKNIADGRVSLKAIRHIDYLSSFSNEAFMLYKSLSILKKHTNHVLFTYYPVGIVIKHDQHFVTGHNILVGNSAHRSNNHEIALRVLLRFQLDSQKIIVPLSYGKQRYAKEVIQLGNHHFGSRFSPMTTFLPLDKYHEVLQTCGIVVMNHYISQAAGNIFTALYMGAKVYLSDRNILYQYFTRIGCYLYCTETDLIPENTEALHLLSREQMQHNREVLKREISLKRIVKELRGTLGPFLRTT